MPRCVCVCVALFTLDLVNGFVEKNFSGIFLLTNHQPVLGFLFGNEFDHHGFVVAQSNAFVNIGESSTAHKVTQLIIITKVRLHNVKTNHVEQILFDG